MRMNGLMSEAGTLPAALVINSEAIGVVVVRRPANACRIASLTACSSAGLTPRIWRNWAISGFEA